MLHLEGYYGGVGGGQTCGGEGELEEEEDEEEASMRLFISSTLLELYLYLASCYLPCHLSLIVHSRSIYLPPSYLPLYLWILSLSSCLPNGVSSSVAHAQTKAAHKKLPLVPLLCLHLHQAPDVERRGEVEELTSANALDTGREGASCSRATMAAWLDDLLACPLASVRLVWLGGPQDDRRYL